MVDEERDAPPPYFGDHPDGSYWSAHPIEGARIATGRPPWARQTPRTPEEPYPLRMFAEDSCDFALWGPVGEPPPWVDDGTEHDLLEDVLPISADLRERLISWASSHWDFANPRPGDDLDEEGFELSRRLAVELGELFSVEFFLEYAGAHQDELRRRAAAEPLDGWMLHER